MSSKRSLPAWIPQPDGSIERAARLRQQNLTKPPQSLGRLEELAIRIASFQATEAPSARPCSAFIFAADHPVTQHGVSPYPSTVTRAMLDNFAHGGAAAAVLARSNDVPLHVFDVGVQGTSDVSGDGQALAATLHRLEPVPPEGDIRREDALDQEAFERCLAAGEDAVERFAPDARLLVLGEMGIGNSTLAAAIVARLLGAVDPTALVGAGTGATGAVLDAKKAVVRDVVARLGAEQRPLEILRRAGGRELVAVYGAMRAALCRRAVVLVDGFILSAVAAVLLAEQPAARAGLIFAHRSREHGHGALLEHLRVQPLLSLDLCLGEASGALTALPIVESACALHTQMATFASARIPGALES